MRVRMAEDAREVVAPAGPLQACDRCHADRGHDDAEEAASHARRILARLEGVFVRVVHSR